MWEEVRRRGLRRNLDCLSGEIQQKSVFLAEAVLDQGDQRIERYASLAAFRLDQDLMALAGREHHQPHDRGAADGVALARDAHLGIEA